MCIHVAARDIEIAQRTPEAEDSNPTRDNNSEVSFRDNLVKEPEEVIADHDSYSTSVWAAKYNVAFSHLRILSTCVVYCGLRTFVSHMAIACMRACVFSFLIALVSSCC